MPIRMLRDWTDSAKVDALTIEAEVTLVRLIMKADDYGRFYGDAKLVRAMCFPMRDNLKTDVVEKWLSELHRKGMIARYEVDGRMVLALVNFGQRLKQSKAKFPPITGESDEWKPTSGNFREDDADFRPRIEHEVNTKEKGKGAPLARPTLFDVVAFCQTLNLPKSDAEAQFHKWEGNGWTNGGKPIKNWQATIRSWQAAGYMPSQKTTHQGQPASTQPKLFKMNPDRFSSEGAA